MIIQNFKLLVLAINSGTLTGTAAWKKNENLLMNLEMDECLKNIKYIIYLKYLIGNKNETGQFIRAIN
jgi:hypothetical protein